MVLNITDQDDVDSDQSEIGTSALDTRLLPAFKTVDRHILCNSGTHSS